VIFAHLIQSASNLPTDASALESSISALESVISALESEVKALERLSSPWEHSVWIFTALVVVGVAMELWVIRHEYREDRQSWALAHFGVFRSPGRPSINKLIVEVGSVLLITLGIMGELVVGIKIASINGALRGKSAELRSKNAELRSKSDLLLVLVTRQAGDAKTSSQSAEGAAKGARIEADSFEKDIVSAKTQAADAESHLASALKQAADATAELNRLKSPRSVVNVETLISVLRAFKGTEYTVIGCFQDQESIDLLVQLDKVLVNAGWIRVKPPPQNSFGDIQLNISKDFAVPIAARSGIFVAVQSAETIDALKAIPQPMLPTYIRAGMALKGGLASSISPAQADLATPLVVESGKSTSVFILVGKKP